MTINYDQVLDDFSKNLSILKSVPSFLKKEVGQIHITSSGLKASASRSVVPTPFQAFIDIMNLRIKPKFPKDLFFTSNDVIESDKISIEKFSVLDLEVSQLNLGYLVRAASAAATSIGMYRTKDLYQLMDLQSSLESYPNNTSSGFPVFKHKGTDEARKDAFKWASRFISKPSIKTLLKQPTAVFHRFQFKFNLNKGTLNKKIRQVWGVSYRVLAVEGVLFRNMVKGCSDFCESSIFPSSTWGRSLPNVSRNVLPFLRTYKKNIIGLDIESFDQSVPSYMWALFYALLPQCIENFNESKQLFKNLMIFDCFTPYCWHSTNVKYQMRGVPSGSLKTSLFDTFVNLTVINYAFIEYNKGSITAQNRACALGDDIVVVEDNITYSHIVSTYKRFNLNISVEKSKVSKYYDKISFIGYIWDQQNRPTNDIMWYAAHFAIPSRFIRNPPFSIELLQTYRCITTASLLYGGMDVFYYLIGWKDKVYQRWLSEINTIRGYDPLITHVSEDQRETFKTKIPLSLILTEGWTAFG